MLDKETLDNLKLKLPHRYSGKVISAYAKRFGTTISRPTVSRFFSGKTYSVELHQAVLDVASAQQILKDRTTQVINA